VLSEIRMSIGQGYYNKNRFLNYFYPANGTTEWRDGFKNETYTLFRASTITPSLGDVDSIILISAYATASACLLIFLCAFCNCYRAEKLEATKRDSIMMSGQEYDVAFKTETGEGEIDQPANMDTI